MRKVKENYHPGSLPKSFRNQLQNYYIIDIWRQKNLGRRDYWHCYYPSESCSHMDYIFLILHDSSSCLGSSGKELFWVLSLAEAKLMGTRERTFSTVASQVWNFLLREVCLALTWNVFRKGLKMGLYIQAFNIYLFKKFLCHLS